jgi:glycosyltransferase involved in cell wall biosynthesis
MNEPVLRILGTRGVPAAHGGFETFAEHLALFLVARGWKVIVYGQEPGHGPVEEDLWQGVHRVRIPVAAAGSLGTVVFDARATLHAARAAGRSGGVCLTLGYNTALFCAWLRLRGVPNVINMDGIEWRRAKWGRAAKAWFWLNDWAGCWLGNHLVADHPEIALHLATRVPMAKITTIAYGADRLLDVPKAPIQALGLQSAGYLTLIARPEPENSVLEIVRAFSRRRRGLTLVVLGQFDEGNAYHREVQAAASDEVRFIGAVYERSLVRSLRFHGLAYVHGHQVGGTNPSLVEALGAGNAVMARDNAFNRWVAGDGARYFEDEDGAARLFDELQQEPQGWVPLRAAATARFESTFTWEATLARYEQLLRRFLPGATD